MKTIYSIICAFCMVFGFTACSSDDDHGTGSVNVSGSCLVEKFVLNGQYEGTITTETRLIKVKVPVDFTQTNDMEVTSLVVSEGAQTNIKVGDHLNFNADRMLRVTNGDLQLDYQITVRNDEALLKNFVLEGVKGAINQQDKTVTVSVTANSGIDLANATFEVECSEDAICSPASGTKGNFTEPFLLTLTDNTAVNTYTVNVTLIENPVALFVGSAATVEELNDEEKAAAKWLTGNISGAAYASWTDIISGNMSLAECKLIFWHHHHATFSNYKTFAEHEDEQEAMEDIYPNNCWGGGNGEGSDVMGDDPWHFFAYDTNHALWKNTKAYPGAAEDAVYTLDKDYTICNTTCQFALWDPYTDSNAFETISGARALAHGGDGAIVAWELKAANGQFGKGGIICFGSGLWDWNSPTPYTSNYHDNIGTIMLNAFDYLTK